MTTKATYISGMFRRLAPANEARARIFGNRLGLYFLLFGGGGGRRDGGDGDEVYLPLLFYQVGLMEKSPFGEK